MKKLADEGSTFLIPMVISINLDCGIKFENMKETFR